jgi:DNA-3-methyladenine glycosylase I
MKAGDNMKDKVRCGWVGNELARVYHDEEWGVPVHDDRKLFEFIVLEGAQAGLSWDTILRKRECYRKVMDGFNPEKVARYGDKKIAELLAEPGIIRNRLKVLSAISNAQAFLKVAEEFGSFDAYIWSFVEGRPIVNRWEGRQQVPAVTKEAEVMAKDLKRRGFKFMGPTICYAHMQATGMVNDHTTDCFRWKELSGKPRAK